MEQHRPDEGRGSLSPHRPEKEMKSDGERSGDADRPRREPAASWGGADRAQHAPVRAAGTRGGGRRVGAWRPVRYGAPSGAAGRGGGGGGARGTAIATPEAAQRLGTAASGGARPDRMGRLFRGRSGQARRRRGGPAPRRVGARG